ncbi:hypothetical protein MM221_13550 [Salipaludibacillus sp. LMS25]|jgi:NADH:ubiquinone oxidoreductase subunit 6 (subunit J)|uniref:hypothetical protein n=1 Tax=Salipaludibacillus sp. LMS25 TaxID=2924031 RepID=UPI0020D0365B|nr:hypothetical protein [Salipaludibacillus sp. LMS25]UTR13640.1 hypothetical protein MM221_13550 [Salipaludibacillus sp. LMS25]
MLETFVRWGNYVGGVVMIICLVVMLIINKRMGSDERAKAISARTFSVMFFLLGGMIVGAVMFGVDEVLTSSGYQNLTLVMFALTFLIGTVYLLVLQFRN